MSNKDTEKTLRERYISNEIFLIGSLVEDAKTGEKLKIIDRGANYITVASSNGISKKWLSEVVEEPITEPTQVNTPKLDAGSAAPLVVESTVDKEFELLESGQIKIFGHETKNFDCDLSTLMLEQFSEFDDLYSKHQIVKCLDLALHESNIDRMYELLGKVEIFYKKQNMSSPFIVEAMKNDIERKRIAEIIAAVAEIEPSPSNYQTVVDSIKALKIKYKTKQQWEVLWPFLKLAKESGLAGIMVNLPFNFSSDNKTSVTEEIDVHDIIVEAMEDNLELLIDDLEYSDVASAFDESDFVDEELSIETREKLSRKMKQFAPMLGVKRERAMTKSASTAVIMQRARRLAEIMLKTRIFHKPAHDMSRQEKERFEAGASKRTALVARLAQKLVGKVRMLQTNRIHHTNTPASPVHDKATASIARASSHGAS